MGRTIRMMVLATVLLAALPAGAMAAGGTGAAAAVQAGPAVVADFNGDGIDDLVVGVPGEDIGATTNAGAVNVIYGSESGLPDGPRQQLTQALAEPGDGFGTAVATGDFNDDILTDLAVGVPGENVGGIADAGAVEIFYGSGGVIGLPAVGDQLLRQGAGGMAGVAEAGDRFGAALATGLVNNGDGAELAIGAPGEDVGVVGGAGAVSLVDGAAGGLLGGGNVLITERNPEPGDGFGAAVAIGDLSGGGDPAQPDDLAVGIPRENVGTATDAGAVNVLDSADDGSGLLPSAVQDQYFQGNNGVPGASESGDLFGSALAAGLFGSGGVDLAVGVPGENVGAAADAGAVVVLAGPTTHQLLTQGGATTIGSLPGATEAGDRFGSALGAADFDDNNADNLVVGVPGENLGAVADAGAVLSLCGFDGQFGGCADGVLTQGNPEAGDRFGAALTPGNFDGNEFPDLAVGAPGETVAGKAAAGAADARDGEDGGLPAGPDAPLYFQGSAGVPGTAEAGDRFAAALSA